MTRRAIILVPGFKKREHQAARDQLVEAIKHYGSGYRVEPAPAPMIGGLTPAALTATNRSTDADVSELHVYEVFWGDLIQDWSNESPWARFKRGLYLIWYWVAGGFLRALLRFEFPARTALAMLIAAIMLLAWYLTVISVLLSTFGTAESGLPAQLQTMVASYPVVGEVLGFIDSLKSVPLILFIMGLAALGGVEPLANMSSFVKDYLRDEPETDVDIGLRAKARTRLITMLDHVTRPEAGYDDVHVVAHSLGGAFAIDALADYGNALPRITLHTWGSALGLLVQQTEWVERKIEAIYRNEVSLHQWIDVVFPNDVLGSPRPLPRDSHSESWRKARFDERFTPTIVPPRTRRAPFAYTRTHNAYFRCAPAIQQLLMPSDRQAARAVPATGLRAVDTDA